MKGLAKFELHITNHAYEQYCDRVEAVTYEELRARCGDQLSEDYNRSGEFLQLGGVWWVFSIKGEKIRFVTCYGESHFDMPAAVEWAKHSKDRIVLGGNRDGKR